MRIQHITAPHPAFSEVGPRLLMKELVPARATDLEFFINKKFAGLELKCSCGTLNSLKNFSCAKCSSSLELRQDLVTEDNGAQHIKPNTLRAWCTGINWGSGQMVEACRDPYTTEDNFPGNCTGCKKDGLLKYSGLVGNETTELMIALCLALSDKNEGCTTNFYQTLLSASSTKAALDLLTEFGYLKKRKTDFTLSRLISKPDYFLLTPKGEKRLAAYSNAFGEAGLLGVLNDFLAARVKYLSETPSLSERQHFEIALSKLKARDLPADVRKSLLLTELTEDRFRKEIAKYAEDQIRYHSTSLPDWLIDFYGKNVIEFVKTTLIFTYPRKKNAAKYLCAISPPVTEEAKMNILDTVGHSIKFTGLIAPLQQYAKRDMLTAVEQNYLISRFAEPARGVTLGWQGILQRYQLQMPGRQLRLTHVASADRDNIYAADYGRIWTPDMVRAWTTL